jgi:ATP-dependent DNA helicase RecG
VVAEAIVNAVAHRDYTSNGSVQVMLFADRLEIWNPGTLPKSLMLEKLRLPHGSVPANPLLAEPLYLTKYIERMGTGTRDMIRRCREAGLPEPEFSLTDGFVVVIRRKAHPVYREVTGEVTRGVTGEVRKLLLMCRGGYPHKAGQF